MLEGQKWKENLLVPNLMKFFFSLSKIHPQLLLLIDFNTCLCLTWGFCSVCEDLKVRGMWAILHELYWPGCPTRRFNLRYCRVFTGEGWNLKVVLTRSERNLLLLISLARFSSASLSVSFVIYWSWAAEEVLWQLIADQKILSSVAFLYFHLLQNAAEALKGQLF